MATSRFFAYLDRLRWIRRWGLMRNVTEENVMEHSWQVATIAHALALIRTDVLNLNDDGFTPEQVATTALYHDCSEIITGDMPSPVKYHSQTISDAYKRIEDEAEEEILSLLPAPLTKSFSSFLLHRNIHPDIAAIVKTADLISAYLKCQAELHAGNKEFTRAETEIGRQIRQLQRPEADYFMAHFVESYQLNLDELLSQHDAG
ncbi:5'-deoxynucleotidase [Reinekea blandensis]|uniref:Predicted Hydrolase of HD superfamily protein n=1 Tax=Reinekea blandensis MED297 TaxID=314283 RepID=A4BBX4_9GAMM|nr:5'-deoxynucleotidase [Reinekea blandensis]EAR10459.1 predicted Hydrolase of HD superfamily protein [Reinekea sp. MED297] [Reinekea blandensis MED297]